MTNCAVCGVEVPAGEKLCSHCGYHTLGDELLSDPGLAQVRSELGRALEYFYHGEARWTLRTLADARTVIEYFNAQVPEN